MAYLYFYVSMRCCEITFHFTKLSSKYAFLNRSICLSKNEKHLDADTLA